MVFSLIVVATAQATDAGTYRVGSDIQPGIYAGNPGSEAGDSCYWARLSGLSGGLDDIISNDSARGQFYVEVKSTDSYFTVRCEVTPLAEWPVPSQPLSEIGTGMYIVGRDIAAGIYAGNPGSEDGDSCYWKRLSGASGELDDIISNDIARGQFYVEVKSTDSYFAVRCEVITPLAEWPVPSQPLSEIGTGMYIVGRDIAAGIYAGNPGSEDGDSCYWKRLSGASGESGDIISNDIARGQFYVEVKSTDSYFTVRCEVITPLAEWPVPSQPLSEIGTGMYIVGRDIAAGIYAGNPGSEDGDSCYWKRLSGASGESGDIISNDIARGQFYVEVKSTDSYFTVRCEVITPLAEWPVPSQALTTLEPGMYLVHRDISPGTYSGQAGDGILDSCYWKRLSGVSGDFTELIDNDIATGTYSVVVEDTDFALATRCSLSLVETIDTGTSTWRGLTIDAENRCSPYDSNDYRYPQSVEAQIVADMGGIIYGPYTGTHFDSTSETDIEHMVARSEAHDSGLCDVTSATRTQFSRDLLNLTLASPTVNRHQKRAKDAAEWLPDLNQCWFADRVVKVRQEYDLTIDQTEADALDAVFDGCTSFEMIVTPDPDQLSLTMTVSGTPQVRIGTAIEVTASFSTSTSGFTDAVITSVNGSVSNFTDSAGDAIYTFDVTPNAIGVVTVAISHGDASASLSLGIPYDDDGDGAISRDEVITAIGDYLFSGLLTRDQVIALISLYLFG